MPKTKWGFFKAPNITKYHINLAFQCVIWQSTGSRTAVLLSIFQFELSVSFNPFTLKIIIDLAVEHY